MRELKDRLDRELRAVPLAPLKLHDLQARAHARIRTQRIIAGVLALVVGSAAVLLVAQTFGEPPSTTAISSDTDGPAVEVLLSSEEADPIGTIEFDGVTRTYRPNGFCPAPDCRSVTHDPIPAEYLDVPPSSSVRFRGTLDPVSAQVTLQTHRSSVDFGELAVDIEDRVARLNLPVAGPSFYLLDITALGDRGYTHFYFGLSTEGPSTSSSTDTESLPVGDTTRMEVYEAAVRHLISLEAAGRWDTIFIRETLCENADSGSFGKDCETAFTPQEQSYLANRLADEARVFFVTDFSEVHDRDRLWASGRGVYVWVGPLHRRNDHFEVAGSMVCGGLCGTGSAWEVRQTAAGWKVVGTVEGAGSWIA
ncbi:MAG: hypothetical protein WEA54_01065 [Actinomycetota bacterium]